MNVADNIRTTVKNAKPSTVFFAYSFPHFDEEYVGKVLADLHRDGVLFRLSRGVYLKAEQTKYGMVYPTVDSIAHALAKRDNADILPCGDAVLQMLGFSTQVPMKYEYVTTGSARRVKVGDYTITFKRGTPKNFAIKGKYTRLIVQAMKSIGEAHFDQEDEAHLKSLLREHPEIDTVQEDLTVMPQWVRKRYKRLLNEIKDEQ